MGTTIPDNTAAFELGEITACVHGQLMQAGSGRSGIGVSTDSRRIRRDNVFVALVGDRFDGHDHATIAADAGASVLLVSRSVEANADTAIIRVEDTLQALGQLGREHRRRWSTAARAAGLDGKIVGVTGSAGKTTTCRAIHAVLQAIRPGGVHTPVGNLNNAIGIPLVLLGLGTEHGQAVVEIGTNSPGEIAYGGGLTEPDVAVLTLVACAHTQGLGTIEAVAQEKGELFAALGPAGVCVANADDAHVRSQIKRSKGARVITFGCSPEADVRVLGSTLQGSEGQELRLQASVGGTKRELTAYVPLLGAAGVYATSAALAVAWAMAGDDIDLRMAAEGLRGLRAEAGRLRPRKLMNGTIVIDDAYNANPASMRDSIDVAAQLAGDQGRRLKLVLGEMRELGVQSECEHQRVGRQVASVGADLLVAVAGDARHFADIASKAGIASEFVDNAADAAERVLSTLGENDLILVKGSRGVALEQVVAALDVGGAGHSQ